MTDDEKRQQKAMLLLEFQEAEQELAQLEFRARKLSNSLAEISDWIKSWSDPASRAILKTDHIRSTPIDAAWIQEALDLERLKRAVIEVKQAREKVEQLREAKKALGLK